ncbi:PREDICTED: uncharacterized protein LOC103602474 [Galeopterus variegatus]|uniref:Uncharacterized protein LOC103602474 n=1 Tax=Galeopterus variegatus TaxID=482537 RepID=A0ABM0RWV8_GALVR|nr:PREDICTED: uncharacterized protein LOC103602474 [Galeopterus variegatus]
MCCCCYIRNILHPSSSLPSQMDLLRSFCMEPVEVWLLEYQASQLDNCDGRTVHLAGRTPQHDAHLGEDSGHQDSSTPGTCRITPCLEDCLDPQPVPCRGWRPLSSCQAVWKKQKCSSSATHGTRREVVHGEFALFNDAQYTTDLFLGDFLEEASFGEEALTPVAAAILETPQNSQSTWDLKDAENPQMPGLSGTPEFIPPFTSYER